MAQGSVTTAVATAAPVDIQVGERTWRLSPLADADYGEFERWVQDQIVAIAVRNAGGMEPGLAERVIAASIERASRVSLTSAEGLAALQTMAGSVRLLLLSLRHAQPDVTEADVLHLVEDPSAFDQLMARLEALNRIAGPKRRARRRVRRRAK